MSSQHTNRTLVSGIAAIVAVIAATLALAANADEANVKVLGKAKLDPIDGAAVQVAKEDGDIIAADETGKDGCVLFKGLRPTETYTFRVNKTGYRRTYVASKPDDPVKIELVKKYGP